LPLEHSLPPWRTLLTTFNMQIAALHSGGSETTNKLVQRRRPLQNPKGAQITLARTAYGLKSKTALELCAGERTRPLLLLLHAVCRRRELQNAVALFSAAGRAEREKRLFL